MQAERWREHFIDWITHDDITFEQAASPRLRQVILGGGPIIQHLLPSARTVRSWLINTYRERFEDVKKCLASSRSKINLSFDAWSSPNRLSLLGVVGHWIDKNAKLKTCLLALRPLEGHHGRDIASLLLPVIKSLKIEHKVGAFQMDNAANNDTTLEALAVDIPGLNVKQQRLRCFGHIINLVVKALLNGSGNGKSLQQQLGEVSDEDAFNVWREQGAIGKLHNIVYYITRSDKRRRAFEAVQQKLDHGAPVLQLVRDIGVRWNSSFDMIERALRLEHALRRYLMQWLPERGEQYDIANDSLDGDYWEELRSFAELLRPFNQATKRAEGNATEGSHGALWEVIPTMNYLFTMLKSRADDVTARPGRYSAHYSHCLNHGYLKLQDYFTKIDDSRLYSAAVVLNPCRRFTYFENSWSAHEGGRAMIDNAKRWTRELFEEYLKRLPESAPDEPDTEFIGSDDLYDDDKVWAAHMGDPTASIEHDRRQQRKLQESELDRFMADNTLNTFVTVMKNGKPYKQTLVYEPLRWWRERGEHLYPTLASMAYDLFSIPAMSAECERAFSLAKRLIADDRYNLKPDVIEADQCIKSWCKHGIVDGQAAFTNIAVADDEIVDTTS